MNAVADKPAIDLDDLCHTQRGSYDPQGNVGIDIFSGLHWISIFRRIPHSRAVDISRATEVTDVTNNSTFDVGVVRQKMWYSRRKSELQPVTINAIRKPVEITLLVSFFTIINQGGERSKKRLLIVVPS